MGATPRSPGHQGRANEPDITERSQVRHLVNALQHALRALPLYGGASPAVQRARETLHHAFREVWKSRPVLMLTIGEDGFYDGEHCVARYQIDTNAEVASHLQAFRQAQIHSITFLRGFEQDEVARFLELVSGHSADDPSDDLATHLWFADLQCFDFELQECHRPPHPIAGRAEADAFASVAQGAPDDPPGIPQALLNEPLSAPEVLLTPEELQHLQSLWSEEERRTVCQDVLTALLDTLQLGDDDLRKATMARLKTLLPELMQQGHLREVGVLVEELRVLSEASQDLGTAWCTALQRMLSVFERSLVMTSYLADLESGEVVPDPEDLSRLVRSLGQSTTATLVRIAETTRHKSLGKVLMEACERVVADHPDLLLDLLRSDDALVQRGTLALLRPTHNDEAVREVTRLLRHREARMRLAAARALVSVHNEESMRALVTALGDENEDVRQTSAWALATWEYRPAAGPLLDILQGSRIKDMQLTEKLTYFDAYARLAGEEAVPFLEDLLHARHLFRPRYESDLRACAARALGQIPGPRARQALHKARKDNDPRVRRIALRQASAARKGRSGGGAP